MLTLVVVKVDVTAEHIAKGTPCDDEACPIVLALQELVVPNVHVTVDAANIILTPVFTTTEEPGGVPYLDYERNLPEAADVFIALFDEKDERAVPFSFDYEVPNVFLKSFWADWAAVRAGGWPKLPAPQPPTT